MSHHQESGSFEDDFQTTSKVSWFQTVTIFFKKVSILITVMISISFTLTKTAEFKAYCPPSFLVRISSLNSWNSWTLFQCLEEDDPFVDCAELDSLSVSPTWGSRKRYNIDSLIEGPVTTILEKNPFGWETRKQFIQEGESFIEDPLLIMAGIINVARRSLPSSHQLKLIDLPKVGFLGGRLRMILPTGEEVYHNFKEEKGVSVQARIIDININSVIYEGEIYFSSSCFCFLRRDEEGGYFEEFIEQRRHIHSGRVIYIKENEGWNTIFELIKVRLVAREKRLEQFALGQTMFSFKRLDEFYDQTILVEEVYQALSFAFPFMEIELDWSTYVKFTFTGRAETLLATGRIEVRIYHSQTVIKIKSFARPNKPCRAYMFVLPSLQLVYPIEKDSDGYDVEIENISDVKAKVEAQRKLLEDRRAYLADQYKQKNPAGSSNDLVPDEYISNKTIAVFNGNGGDEYFSPKVRGWLEKKGFKVKHTKNSKVFLEYLEEKLDLIWIISGHQSSPMTRALAQKVYELHKQGIGLLLWADNKPHFADANNILQLILNSPDSKLIDDYAGEKTLKPSFDELKIGTFDANHEVSTGLLNLYEGHTICYPNDVLEADPRIKVFAYNTNPKRLQPVIFYTIPASQEGIVWIDTGFTKLNPRKELEEEIRRYVVNINAYLCPK